MAGLCSNNWLLIGWSNHTKVYYSENTVMADRPLESELMMTTYTQLGRDLSDHVDHLDVFVPSGIEESELGFDIQLPNLKGLVLQFKRPYEDSPRRFYIRYSNQNPPRQLDRMRNWELLFGPNAAYYSFPLVITHDDLGETLQNIAFLRASELDSDASVVRIPGDYIVDGYCVGTDPIEIYCSDPNDTSVNRTTTIPSDAVLGWLDLKKAVGNCTAAFRMRRGGESYYYQYMDDYKWYPKEQPDIQIESMSEWFVEAGGPFFTRLGTKGSFGW